MRIGRLLTDVPEGFHIGLFVRQDPTGRVDTWVEATGDLAMSRKQVADVLQEALDRFEDSIRVDSTTEEMEQQL